MIRVLAALRGLLVPRDDHAAAVRAIVELIDGSVLAAEADAALAHVESCPACRHEVADYAPIVFGLRRFGDAVRAGAMPPAGGWSRLAVLLPGRPPRRPTSLRSVAPALVAPLVVAFALMPTIGLTRPGYDVGAALSETGAAVGSASALPLRPAERAVDERANYDVLRWAGTRDWVASAGVTQIVGLRIPGVPTTAVGERETQADAGSARDRAGAVATDAVMVRGWDGQ